MSASPKSKRISPTSKFEDYVLTYTVGQSLYPISSDSMSYVQGSAGLPFSIGDEIVDLDFNFVFDNKTYRRVYVTTYGFVILLDPQSDPELAIDTTMDSPADNASLITSTWSAAHVVIAPWWDEGIRSVWRHVGDSGASTYVANQGLTVQNLNLGISTMPEAIDSRHGGIKYFRGFDNRDGKFLLLRWKVASNSASTDFNVLSYDLVIYESGIIEVRYAPSVFLTNQASESATAAIFANGGSNYGNRYRDFSQYIRKDSRGQYKNGGGIYDGSYTDTDGYTTTSYTVSLNVEKDWPGIHRGAMFRLTPPRVRRRQNRRVVPLRDSATFISSGMFNDQKTINRVSQTTQMGSMLPSRHVLNMNDIDSIAIIELYTSGSMETSIELRPSLSDSVVFDSIAERGKK